MKSKNDFQNLFLKAQNELGICISGINSSEVICRHMEKSKKKFLRGNLNLKNKF